MIITIYGSGLYAALRLFSHHPIHHLRHHCGNTANNSLIFHPNPKVAPHHRPYWCVIRPIPRPYPSIVWIQRIDIYIRAEGGTHL
ncbi:MAG: hypothetical protein MJZ86_09185 [Bacteroidales bacterium]|nr:hypothetical protein [Bacteroidales bacterium]